ncbi:MAG: thioredoxin family protein [Candidatus Micrarchaeia archaeon]
MGKHNIEFFSGGCPLCAQTIANLRKAVDKNGCGCQITEHICSGEDCCEPAKKYGVKAVPTIVVDGSIAIVGKASAEEIASRL